MTPSPLAWVGIGLFAIAAAMCIPALIEDRRCLRYTVQYGRSKRRSLTVQRLLTVAYALFIIGGTIFYAGTDT